jgi:hypothetical protein
LKIFVCLLLVLNVNLCFPQDLFTETNNNNINKDSVVAQVGTIAITAEEFFYSYEFGPAFPKREKKSKETHLKYIINEKLMALGGYNEGVMNKDYEKEILNDFQSDLAAEEMFRKEILPRVEISENEIEKIMEKKLVEFNIRWLYSETRQSLESDLRSLNEGVSFDTLFNAQFNDSVFLDDRQMNSTLYEIYMKNPVFARILDTLKAGTISAPIHTDDGWYIIKIDNIIKSLITTESEQNKLRYESVEALKKSRMNALSDEYVQTLFENENPIIKRDAFNILRSYLGKFILTKEKYADWDLDIKLDSALSNLGLKRGDKYPGITLVTGENSNYSLDEFIVWYRNREEYIKFSKNDLISFSKSLENLIWVMVRDRLISGIAAQKGYNDNPWVKKQTNWWRDKIAYSAYKNELERSIRLTTNEIKLVKEKKKSKSEIMNNKLNERMLHKILELKNKYKIRINKDVLNKIKVSSENDRKAINIYFIKRGNLIPRPLFPSIDNEWLNWE